MKSTTPVLFALLVLAVILVLSPRTFFILVAVCVVIRIVVPSKWKGDPE